MDLIKIAKYQIWANNILREMVHSISDDEFKQTFYEPLTSVQELIVHIILAIEFNLETIFYKNKLGTRQLGRDFNQKTQDEFIDHWIEMDKKLSKELYNKNKDELVEQWVETDKKLLNLITKMDEEVIIFPNFIRGKGSINMYQEDFFFQYLSHTIYHRAQLMSALKLLGKEGKTTDYLFYLFILEEGVLS